MNAGAVLLLLLLGPRTNARAPPCLAAGAGSGGGNSPVHEEVRRGVYCRAKLCAAGAIAQRCNAPMLRWCRSIASPNEVPFYCCTVKGE